MDLREKINVSELVKEYVNQCERNYDPSLNNRNKTSQRAYSESLQAMKNITLGNITEENTKLIVQPYLYKWGTMVRVLGQKKKYPNWGKKLTTEIRENHKMLKNFRSKDLVNVELNDYKDEIENCYQSFLPVVGRIAATKVLHLICPNFFPMWDNDIANGIRNELLKSIHKENKIEAFSKQDYYRFMVIIQVFLKQNELILSSLSCEPHKTKLKVLDECLLWAVRRPYYLFSLTCPPKKIPGIISQKI